MRSSAQSPSRPSWLRVVENDAPEPRPEPKISDEDIISAFERGDGSTSSQLYDRLIGTVDRTLYRVLGQRDQEHDDLVQSAFEQIMLTLSKGRFARACSLSTWASTITAHVALNALRSRTRERRVVDRCCDAEVESQRLPARVDVEHQAGLQEQLGQLRAELAQMTPEKATTVLLYEVLGHELAEIAVMTNVSVAAAQSRLVRGRKELQQRMEAALASRSRRKQP